MAIPQGRLSTTPVLGTYLPPEGIQFHPIDVDEIGPLAVGDTSQGLIYQTWRLSLDITTGDIILTPLATGAPVILANSAGITFLSFTFDQAARVSYTYTNNTSSYLYWYDTAIAQSVLVDLGSAVITPVIYLDDKRSSQNLANDMLLWYTKSDGAGKYKLYKKIQRERFLIEQEMAANLTQSRIVAMGMTSGLRIQMQLTVS